MKKQLIAAVLLIAAVCMVGCKENQGGGSSSSVTAISISPKSVTLNENENSIKLAVKFTPSDAKATVEWSSSDTTVATVTSKGYVEAQGFGECYVYAKAGELVDSCHISVVTYYESLVFTGAYFLDVDTTYALDTITKQYKVDTIKSIDGDVFYCYRSMATLALFSDGFYVNASGYLDGASVGTIVEVEAPMWYGTEGLNGKGNGVLFSLGEWIVSDTAHYIQEGLPGSLDKEAYLKGMKAFINGYNAKDQDAYVDGLVQAGKAFKNPYLDVCTYDSSDPNNAGYKSPRVPGAICKEADFYVVRDYAASNRMRGLEYCTLTFDVLAQDTVFRENWGLKLGYNETSVYLIDETVTFSKTYTSKYGEKTSESNALIPIKNPFIHSEHPETGKSLKEQIKERAIVLKKK